MTSLTDDLRSHVKRAYPLPHSTGWKWFFNPVNLTQNQCFWKHIHSSNTKRCLIWRNPSTQQLFALSFQFHSWFWSGKWTIGAKPKKCNILNHSYYSLSILLWLNHMAIVSGESTCLQQWWNTFTLKMKVTALNWATKSKSFVYSSRVLFYPDHCPNLLWHWKMFIIIK